MIVFVFALFVTGCNKDEDDNPEKTQDPTSLCFDSVGVIKQLPPDLLASDNDVAKEVVGMVSTATDWSAFDSYFTPPDNAVLLKNSSITYTWTISSGNESITYWWTFEEDETTYYWTLELQINEGVRAPFIRSWEKIDGSAGEVRYNFNWLDYASEEDFEEIEYVYAYSVSASGDYSFTMTVESDMEEYDNVMRYEVLVNADGSGTINYYTGGVLFYHAEWDAAGNGSVTYYLGTTEMTESWTV